MVACGVKHDDIAACLGTRGIDDNTLRKHFRRELDIGVAKVNALCGQGLVRLMQEGNLGALCFWAKTRMGWRETQKIEVSGSLSLADVDKMVSDFDATNAKS